MASRTTRVLILCKTYPSPSGKHIETSCVAGMEEGGSLIRLFPVPFRLIGDDQQFKKWQWVTVRVDRPPGDQRRESHKVFVDTIKCEGPPISTSGAWRARRAEIEKIPVFTDFSTLDVVRQSEGKTLGLVRPSKVLGLDITASDRPDWTKEDIDKLVQHEKQGGLFDDKDAKSIARLKKLPYDFHYRYMCRVDGADRQYRHKIVDWEIGALFWNCHRHYGDEWEKLFRHKLEEKLPAADLQFLMGNIHRFPDQWLIVSLIYPPRQQTDLRDQQLLLDL